jgi:hypothetical protein
MSEKTKYNRRRFLGIAMPPLRAVLTDVVPIERRTT